MPTGDEFEIALAAQAVFQLGRAALSRALPLPAASTPSEAVALKPYGAELGHHIPAKKAFEGAAGYDAKAALAIPKSELERLGIKHSTVTGAQNSLYRAFAKSGGQLSWEDIARIETEALVRAGMNDSVARATVEKAISSLKEAGVQAPTRIPWGK